jgi:hypothetical protein
VESDLCAAEQFLVNNIPDSEFGSSCASYAASTPNPLIPPAWANNGQGTPQAQVSTPVTPATPATPVTPANPAGAAVTFTASDSCSTVSSKIAALQAAGQSNITIWNQVPDALLTCSAVMALNPTDAVYDTQAGASQPGGVSSGGAGSGGTGTGNNSTPAAVDNTPTYIAIGAAVLIGLWAISKN